MTYREMTIETIKIACQDLIDRAEELIPDVDCVTGINVVMKIPSLSDRVDCIPTVKVVTDCYTSRVAAEKIIDMMKENGL